MNISPLDSISVTFVDPFEIPLRHEIRENDAKLTTHLGNDKMKQPMPSDMRDFTENCVQDSTPSLKTLREQIPKHCFQPSLSISMQYVIRDLALVAFLFQIGMQIPYVVENTLWRWMCWATYGFTQGLVFTGIWILAHECGHDAFSMHQRLNAVLGFILHSIVLVPFFSWKFTHARHHRYANHMEKDTVFVPAKKSEYRSSFWTGEFLGHAADAPIVSIILLLGHQLVGWPIYILLNAGAGSKSLVSSNRSDTFRQSHLDPGAYVFSRREYPYILLSNLGLAIMLCGLWHLTRLVGVPHMCLLWGVPYLWMNHWLVAITYLHHTHPDVPHYTKDSWTFQDGALSTIDRDFGWIGRHMFHGIIEYHVVHHMFPRIPFYYAEEATDAIAPLLGKAYKQQQTSFLGDLWSTFTTCHFVEESKASPGHMYWFQAGRKP